VLISTDKAVAPTSIMGATKRMAEMLVRRLERPDGMTIVVVRFGNVLGSRGSVVPIFKSQIESGGPVTITHPEVRRYFMTIPEAVHLVLRAAEFDESGTYVLDMGTPVRIRDLAEDLIRLSGFSIDEIPIVYTGLRPGEKLAEALWEPSARVDRTRHPGILRVTGERDGSESPIPLLVARFETLARAGNRLELEAALAEQIPSFVPGGFPSVIQIPHGSESHSG
jgi:FlaA1/EpsC-like NDP-sugar epimerase